MFNFCVFIGFGLATPDVSTVEPLSRGETKDACFHHMRLSLSLNQNLFMLNKTES